MICEEQDYPFREAQTIIGSTELYNILRSKGMLRNGRINDVAMALEQIGGRNLGQCRVSMDKKITKPTLYLIRQPPKKFSSNDPSSYPSDRDQRQRLSSWDLIVQSAKGNPSEMREVREILRKHHKTNPGSLTDNELKMIGQYKPKKLETITPYF